MFLNSTLIDEQMEKLIIITLRGAESPNIFIQIATANHLILT